MTTTPERDELAVIISHHVNNEFIDPSAKAADAILAAGYRRPLTITTVTELDALAVGSVVLCRGRAWTRFTPKNIRGGIVQIHKWMCADGGIVRADSDQSILLPAILLYDGGAA